MLRHSGEHEHQRRGRSVRVGVVAALAATVTVLPLLSSSTASASTSSHAKASKLSPDYSFYKGQTITFILATTPGAPPDLAQRAYINAMAAKLDATINIQYNTNSQAVGEDQVAASNNNGLTIGWVSLTSWVYQEATATAAVNFSLQKQELVGAFPGAQLLFASCDNSPIKTATELVHSSSAISALESTSQNSTLFTDAIFDIFGTSHTNLTAYTGSAPLLAGCLRGDGDVAAFNPVSPLNTSENAVDPGITPLILSGKLPSGWADSFLNKGTPTLATLAAKYAKKTPFAQEVLKLLPLLYDGTAPNELVIAPAGTAANKVLALTDAMKAAFAEPSVRAALNTAGAGPGFIAPSTVKTDIKAYVGHMAQFQRIVSGS